MSDEKERSVASGGYVTAGVRKCIAAHGQIAWGWDGDCGSSDIISRIEEECDKIDAARRLPTLTDAEREAVEVAARFMDKWGGVPNTIASATLRGLLERMGDCPTPDNAADRDSGTTGSE